MPTRERITGLILAGGRGTRMGAIDKGLQLLGGRPLFMRTLDRLEPQVGAIVVNANRHLDRYAAAGYRIVEDRVDDHAGPLAGLQAGLDACSTEFLVAVPCDAPFFPSDLVATLGAALEDDAPDGVVDVAVARTAERVHPVFCMMRVTVASDLDAFLDRGGRSVNAWVDQLRSRAVSFGDEASFRNLNTIEELRRAESDVERSG